MDFELARFKAIKYIGISKKSEYEVIMKLKGLNVSEDIVSKVIEYLNELGYINDLDYVDSYIRQNLRMQKYSIFEIREKLKAKGIKSNLIDDRIQSNIPDEYEKKIVEKITNVKSKTLDEQKLRQYLYRRGFNTKEC